MERSIIQQMLDTLVGFNIISIAVRILLAAVIGGCIGSERGRHGHAAGMRTHILVCLGAAMATLIGIYVTKELGYTSDPMRLGAQVISGIGFLGAGTILARNESHVVGLTTSAGLWTTASIGLAIGVGFYVAVFVSFVVVMICFVFLPKLERNSKQNMKQRYYLEINDIRKVNDFIDDMALLISDLQVVPAKSGKENHVGLSLCINGCDRNKALQVLRSLEYVVIAIPA